MRPQRPAYTEPKTLPPPSQRLFRRGISAIPGSNVPSVRRERPALERQHYPENNAEPARPAPSLSLYRAEVSGFQPRLRRGVPQSADQLFRGGLAVAPRRAI